MQNRKGFTLIELLIVVVIIGILAAIAIPKFANTKEKAVLASMKSDLRNIVTAQEAFFSDNQTYAASINPVQTATQVAFVPSQGNVIPAFSTVTAGGWAATVTNPAVKGTIKTCGIYVGTGTPPNGAVKNEGAPACY
ncbi:MAG: prepilin-type N-terminal cleavage/methylation domain-containing protein [Gemmatimonadales bacterium]